VHTRFRQPLSWQVNGRAARPVSKMEIAIPAGAEIRATKGRHKVRLPARQIALAGCGIESGDPVAHPLVAVGSTNDDPVLDGERRRREGDVRGIPENELSQMPLPVSLSVAMMRGELPNPPAPVMTRLPTALRCGFASRDPAWVHAPHDTAQVAGSGVNLVQDVPGVRQAALR
jgi:hypothetical protein